MFNWFKTRDVDEFARGIAADLIKRVPPGGIDPADGKAIRKLLKTQHMVFDRIAQYAGDRRLNVYQRASFGNTIKWSLRDAGYPADVADGWTSELVTYLTLKLTKTKK